MRKVTLMIALMVLTALSVIAQTTRVNGTVFSQEDNEPIAGATVRIDGTDLAMATDLDGNFSFTKVPAGAKKLTVSYIGYVPQTVDIKPDLKIYLVVNADVLDEVIVVAFGKQKRESFTGSATVVGAAELQKQTVVNPVEALNGRVAGMQMTQTNSFSDDPVITIRGIGSLNANTEPLIILDGLPYNGYLTDINSADIENITVLKDAASNALYGARGANGVILITTRSAGRSKTRVTFDGKWGVNHDARVQYDYIDNPGEYYEAYYLALRNYAQYKQGMGAGQAHMWANNTLGKPSSEGGLGYMVYTVPDGENLIGINGKLNPHATLGNRVSHNGEIYTLLPDDWTKNGLRDGFRQEYNLSLSGGNEQFAFIGSLGYLDEEGISYGTDIERYTARLKAEYQAYPFLRVGANANYNHTVTNGQSAVYTCLYTVAPIYPLFIRDADGNIMTDRHGYRYDYGAGDNAGLARPTEVNGNSVQQDLLDVSNNTSNAFNINGFATFNFLKDFSFTVNANVYITENRINTAYNPYYGYWVETGGSTSVYHYRTTNNNFQQLLNWSHLFGKHNVNVLLGHEYTKNTQTTLGANRDNVAIFGQNTEIDGAIINGSMESHKDMSNIEGFFGRAQYDYDSRIFGSASYRRDGSSTFHPSHRWGNFWSLGAAWILTREEWFPKNPVVNMLKVKASYGEQGNDAIGSFRYTDRYSIRNSNNKVAYVFNAKGNEHISWEKVGNFNTGVEFELFNSRITGGLDYYIRTTRDMLMYFSAPYSIGYSGYYDNVGDMRNSGIELSLSADAIAIKNFTWNVGLNLSWQRNRVTYLPDDKKRATLDGHQGYLSEYEFYGEGLPVYTWRLRHYMGVNDQGNALYAKTAEDGTITTTDMFDEGDYYNCGTALPDLFGGFSTSFKIFDFDLSTQFNFSIGGKKFDSGYQSLMAAPLASLIGFGYHRDVLDCWTPENTSSNIPMWYYTNNYSNNPSDRFLINASYLTLRNITVGYTLPKSIASRLMLAKLRVYATAENVAYWTKRKGFDPRMSAKYGAGSGWVSPSRAISGGLSIEF